ncbi:hypothetical protein [Convivina intestini]|uniref:Integral membrane protein n=1 Tax=Convivina intestini TaxID=1505726 RepID=A0A2U1DES0_9LACO|nr:hypothetical protein [Convivina intestini]PVY86180.1 hypothetical protein C7384_10193 [Convivina intestini]CAH1851391.1 hypothetical protein R077811_00318 [Convivina intestini]CAH1852860.1 hypothetical protein R078131_00555 [Convivina intestini]SDB81289.1 hypothetical protein SAMN05216341_10185 [Leuconostocaceae bacterium R-53105]
MSDIKNVIIAAIAVGILSLLERYLPRWFGSLPCLAFLIYMIYIMVSRGPSWTGLLVLVLGEGLLLSIWVEALVARKKKENLAIEKMKAKDLQR